MSESRDQLSPGPEAIKYRDTIKKMFPLKKRFLIRGFQAHIQAGLGGAADYVADYDPIYAPFDGKLETYAGVQGGNWLRLIRDNGDKLEFAHLSHYYITNGFCISGQPIAVTGNTGSITTGPHLHLQIFNKAGIRLDPEKYFMNTMKIDYVGNGPVLETIDQVEKYSRGQLQPQFNGLPGEISVAVGMFTQEQAYALADQLRPQNRFLVLFYQGNSTSTFLATYYYPKLNICISTVPLPADPRSVCFELSHQVQQWYNGNRGANPPVQIVDSNFPTDELIYSKYDSIMPYIDILTGENIELNPMPQPRLIRASKDVYRLRILPDGSQVKDQFINGEAFEVLDGRWDKIETVSQADLDAIKDGKVLIVVNQE